VILSVETLSRLCRTSPGSDKSATVVDPTTTSPRRHLKQPKADVSKRPPLSDADEMASRSVSTPIWKLSLTVKTDGVALVRRLTRLPTRRERPSHCQARQRSGDCASQGSQSHQRQISGEFQASFGISAFNVHSQTPTLILTSPGGIALSESGSRYGEHGVMPRTGAVSSRRRSRDLAGAFRFGIEEEYFLVDAETKAQPRECHRHCSTPYHRSKARWFPESWIE
jgi:hypothetical protein